MPSYNLRVNGFARSVDASDPDKPLLYVLRDFGLKATKFGCGLGQCGACTVLVDGKAMPIVPDDHRGYAGQGGHHARGPGTASIRTRSRPLSSRSRCRNVATAPAA